MTALETTALEAFLTHLFAYMDDISVTVALEDMEFLCCEIVHLKASSGCFVNLLKTRILKQAHCHIYHNT